MHKVVSYITHPVFSGEPSSRISASEMDEMVVTDTIPLSNEAAACGKITQLSLDRLLAESIRGSATKNPSARCFADRE